MADITTGTQTQQPQNQNPAPTPATNQNPAPAEPEDKGGSGSEVTIESLMAQLAEQRAQNAKLKNDNDKLCTSEGNLRKQLRAKQTAEEQEAEAKAEQAQQHEQYVKGLERFKSITESSDRYLSMGMSAEMAKATAAAEVDGEMDTVTSNLTKFMAERDKKKDEEIRAQYMAQMPLPQSGNVGQVDYSQVASKAISDGDFQSAALAYLQQAGINSPT